MPRSKTERNEKYRKFIDDSLFDLHDDSKMKKKKQRKMKTKSSPMLKISRKSISDFVVNGSVDSEHGSFQNQLKELVFSFKMNLK